MSAERGTGGGRSGLVERSIFNLQRWIARPAPIAANRNAIGSIALNRGVVLSVPQRSVRARGGFTLLETALAVVIVGVGVLAIVEAQQAFHRQNAWSTRASVAAALGNEIREMTLNLPRHDPVTATAFWGPEPNELTLQDYDDLDDFDGNGNGSIFSASLGNGPINAQREVIPNMQGWAQVVTVSNVDPSDIAVNEPNGTTAMMRIQVVVTHQGPQDAQPIEITRVSWISPK